MIKNGQNAAHMNTKGSGVIKIMLQVVLCDDNPQFLKDLQEKTRHSLNEHGINAAIHVFEAAEDIPESLWQAADIFLLDIDFSTRNYSGLDIARRIRETNNSAVIIFVTNYIEYAPAGYEVHAFRYVLKSELSNRIEAYLLQAVEQLKADRATMQINIAGEIITLLLADVLYVEARGHSSVIHVVNYESAGKKQYNLYSSLKAIEEDLSPKGFLRIQKSFLVNMRRIKKFQCTQAVLDNGELLPVSEKNYAEQKKRYLYWKGTQ